MVHFSHTKYVEGLFDTSCIKMHWGDSHEEELSRELFLQIFEIFHIHNNFLQCTQ